MFRPTQWPMLKRLQSNPTQHSLLGVSLLLLSHSACAADWRVYSEIESITFSEPTAIKAIVDGDFDDRLDSGDNAFTHSRAELGVQRDQWHIGLISRYDYVTHFSQDAAELFFNDANDLSFEPGRELDVFLSANHILSYGIKLGYTFAPRPDLELTIATSLLKANTYVDGEIDLQGQVQDLSLFDSQLSGRVDYFYSSPQLDEDEIFVGEDFTADNGYGIAVDLAATWQATPDWQWQLQLEDIYNRFYYDSASTTDLTIQQGRTPLVAGRLNQRRQHQRLPWRATLQSRYQLQPWLGLEAEVYYTKFQTLPRLSAHLYDTFGLLYDTQTQAWGLSLQHDAVSLTLLTDTTDLQKSRIFVAAFKVNLRF